MSQSHPQQPPEKFGQRLRDLMEQRGWSQNEFAKRADIHKGTMSRLMRGQLLTRKNIQRLAKALGLSPQALLQQGSWPDLPAPPEPPRDQPSEFVQRAEEQDQDEPKRAPKLKKPPELGHASEAEQIAQLKARIIQLERKLKLAENHCTRTEDQNRDFCHQLFGYEQDIAALTIQRDQAIAERNQALAGLREAQQQLQEGQTAARVADIIWATLGGAATGAGLTGVWCKSKIDQHEKENKYWKDHAAFLQRELEEERRCRGVVAQQGAQLQTPTPSESSVAPVPQGGQAADPQTTEPKVLVLKPIKFDFSSLEGQLKQILAPSAPQCQGAPRPSEGNG
jgi:transcriptional regulator with XRE-family HTH domain